MKFLLGFILALFLVLFIFGSLFGKVIKFMSGNTMSGNQRRKTSGKDNSKNPSSTNRKEFAKDEGEYVNYEEIKDEK